MNDEPAGPGVGGFESASELRAMHEQLLEALDREFDAGDSATDEVRAVATLGPRIRAFIERGAATGVYLEEVSERTAAQVLLDFWCSTLARAGLGAPPSRLTAFDRSQAPDLEGLRCPYVGLDAFRNPDFFFGRESDTRSLLDQLRRTPLVVVVGASGSGKSSLVMGGVLPALAAPASERPMRVAPPVVPGNAALRHVAQAVLHAAGLGIDGADAAAARLQKEPESVIELLGGGSNGPAVLTIDQSEELFTLASREQRDAVAAVLGAMLGADVGHRVILTMREEFSSRLVELRGLAPFLDNAWYSMRPMGYEELRAAVEQPARAVNLQFQSGIVDDLVKKVLGQAAALPLLQFTLRTLWDQRDRNRITWEVYRQVGDPLTALQSSADSFYDSLPPEMQIEARRILLELVRVDELLETYRQPLPRSQLLRAGRANTEAVLQVLAQNDYVRIADDEGTNDAIVEVKHESLIRNWPRLVAWIDEKRIARRQRLALTQAAQRWEQSGRPREGLLTGWQLDEARRQPDLSELENEFVDASSEQVDSERRDRETALRREAEHAQAQARWERRFRHMVVAGAVVALAVIGGFVWMSYLQNQTLARLERIYLAAAASDDPLTQTLLLTELLRTSEPGRLQQYAQLFQDVATTPIPLAVLGRSDSINGVVGVAFADDERVATVDSGGVLRWWPADGRGDPEEVILAGTASGTVPGADAIRRVALVAFSGDRQWLATVNGDGSIQAGSLEAARRDGRLPVIQDAAGSRLVPSAIALSESGDRLAVGGATSIELWVRQPDGSFQADGVLTRGADELDRALQLFVAGLAFDRPAGRLAASSRADGVIRVWTLDSNEPPLELGPIPSSRGLPPQPSGLGFSPDGHWLVSGYDDNVARVWKADGFGPPPLVLEGHARYVMSAVFAPMPPTRIGETSVMQPMLTVVTTADDQTRRMWTLRADALGELKQVGGATALRGQPGAIGVDRPLSIGFSPSGDRVVTGYRDGTARVWWTAPREPAILGWHDDEVTRVSFDASGERVVSSSWDATAGVWSLNGREPQILKGHEGGVRDAAFNPAKPDQVATSSKDGRLGLWDLQTLKPAFSPPDPGGPGLLAVAFDSAGTHVAVATEQHEARIWRLSNGTLGEERPLPHPLEGGEANYWVFDVAFSPDGTQLVTASGDGRARLWSLDGSLLERVLPVYAAQAGGQGAEDTRVLRAIFSPIDGSIATASATGVRVWPVGGQEPWLIRQSNVVNDVAFGPEGLILTASDDETARVFDSSNGGRILTLRNGSKVRAAAFGAAGRHVVTGDVEGGVKLWRVGVTELADYLQSATTACLSARDRERFLSEDQGRARREYERCEQREGRQPEP